MSDEGRTHVGPLTESALRFLRSLGVRRVRLGELELEFDPVEPSRAHLTPDRLAATRPPDARAAQRERERERRRLALASSGVTLAPEPPSGEQE